MRHLTLSWKRSVTQVYEGASVGITDKIWEEFLLPLPGEYVVFPSDYSVFFNVCGAKASNPNMNLICWSAHIQIWVWLLKNTDHHWCDNISHYVFYSDECVSWSWYFVSIRIRIREGPV